MDKTASELVHIITCSNDRKRRLDASNSLIGILPSLDEDSIYYVTKDMTDIISHSNNEERRKLAQDVLVTFKNAHKYTCDL